MDLIRNIRGDRARQKTKQSHEGSVFNTVGCIVKAYGLGRDFLKRIDSLKDHPAPMMVEVSKVKAKQGLELPPYCLVSKEEYGLVMAIVGRLGNPYLIFARSPQEMLLSPSLHQCNGSLKSRDLLRCDYETLLLCESARKELEVLERQLGEIPGTESAGRELENEDGEGSPSRSLQERIKRLQTFVAKVEHTELPTA